MLLEGLTLYGFGNWPDISEHVGTKSEDECFDHYSKLYAGPSLPRPLNQEVQLPPMPLRKIEVQEYCKHRKSNKKTQTSNPIKAELGGYMPMRHEFEFPYNDQAEVPVATVKFSDNDTPEERKIKMDMLDVYHKMLEERRKRSDFVVDNNLLKWKTQQKLQRSLPYDEDKRMLQRLRPLLQVMDKDDWERMVDGMLKESSLRRAIAYYGDLRREGVRSEREAEEYHARARKKGKYQTRREQPAGPPPIYDGAVNLYSSTGGSSKSGSTRQSSQSTVSLDTTGMPNNEILGHTERKLAAELLITPDDFLRAKEAMMREYCRANRLDRSDVRTITPLDGVSASVIFDYLVEQGWIRTN